MRRKNESEVLMRIDNFTIDFVSTTKILRFLSRSLDQYSATETGLHANTASGLQFFFFPEDFLREKKWSVLPLWGTNLTSLTALDGREINLMEKLKKEYHSSGRRFDCYYAIFENSKNLWYADFPTFSISGKKICDTEKWEEFFGIRASDASNVGPYMGNIIIWPEDEEFAIYSDGDNLAFIAGELNKIENLIGCNFDYCLNQFLDFNRRNLTLKEFYLGLENFCRQQLRPDGE